MRPYEEVAPSREEIQQIMKMAKDAFAQWAMTEVVVGEPNRATFYQGFYLGYLVGKAKS